MAECTCDQNAFGTSGEHRLAYDLPYFACSSTALPISSCPRSGIWSVFPVLPAASTSRSRRLLTLRRESTRFSAHDGKWITIDKDLFPLILQGLEMAWKADFLKASQTLADGSVSF